MPSLRLYSVAQHFHFSDDQSNPPSQIVCEFFFVRTTLCATATVSHPHIPESHQLSRRELHGTCR